MYVYVWNVQGEFMDWVGFELIIVSNSTFNILQIVNPTHSNSFWHLSGLNILSWTNIFVDITG